MTSATSRIRRFWCASIALGVASIGAAAIVDAPVAASGATIADHDWRGIVNAYRAMSGLDPVVEQADWSAGAAAHSCYMLQNGMGHDEIPGRPGYSAAGDQAGNSGNVAVHSRASTTARQHIDLWMSGPFHAIGLLRPNLAAAGFGTCSDTNTPTPWESAATLDVLRGIDHGRPEATEAIVFPGRGATIALNQFISESPNPVAMCGWSGAAGLPVVAMMPNGVSTASGSIRGPHGNVEVCVLHAGNVTDPVARSILAGENAVILVPRTPLTNGGYRVDVSTSGGGTSWSFTVDRNASLTAPDPAPDTGLNGSPSTLETVAPFRLLDTRTGQGGATRLQAGTTTRIKVADRSVTAVSANFVAVDPADNGYLTAFNCTSRRPTVSNINYRAGSVVANQTVVPLADGDLCLFTRATTDVVIDVNGFYRSGATEDGFVAMNARRLFDSRSSVKVPAGRAVAVPVSGVPAGATAVALNVTAHNAPDRGWVKVAPCGNAGDAKISSLNYVAQEVRPNSAVVPIGANRSVCVTALRSMHVTLDLAGYFKPSGGDQFQALSPIRLLDTRETLAALNPSTNGAQVRAGEVVRFKVAGRRGIPSSAESVSINIAATAPSGTGAVTAYPCGTRPSAVNVNVTTAQYTIANGAIVGLSSGGDLCIHASAAMHVIVDINGVFS